MKCTFNEHGDAGLYLCDLEDGDDFVFLDDNMGTPNCPATIRGLRYFYYNNSVKGVVNTNKRYCVARIVPSQPVVFILKNEA